jgi:hypothetical protein
LFGFGFILAAKSGVAKSGFRRPASGVEEPEAEGRKPEADFPRWDND